MTITMPTPPMGAPAAAPMPRTFDEVQSTSRLMRWLAAGFSLAAAGIHFGFAPSHLSEDWRHGTFFLVLGWFQLFWAVGMVTRPSKALLRVGILVSLGTIALWAVTRTVGLPTWATGTGEAESVTLGDQLSSILEGLIVVVSAGLLTRPDWRTNRMAAPRLVGGAGFAAIAAVLVASSLSLTPRFTSGHSHGGEAGADHHAAGAAADDHHSGDAAAGAADHHDGMTAMPYEPGESPCEKAQAKYPSDNGEDAADPNNTSGHNHHGASPQQPITPAEREELKLQQIEARSVVDRYPTVTEALADGYKLSTVYLPCIGAHYTKVSLVGQFDPSAPSELLFDGTEPDSKIIGLSYLIVHVGPPEGFAGPNDVWHQHNSNGGLCLNNKGVVIGGEKMSKETCQERGGKKAGLENIWMVHDWVAPGWDCSWGVFADECPELGGRPGGSVHDPIA